MKRPSGKQLVVYGVVLSWLAVSAAAWAQDQQYGPPPAPDTGPGWHQFSNPPSNYPPPVKLRLRVRLKSRRRKCGYRRVHL